MLEIKFSIYNLLSILTSFVGMLYAFQISTLKKSYKVENRYLISFLLSLSVIVILFFLIDLKLHWRAINIIIIMFIVPFILLASPLLWLYIRKLISYKENSKSIFHLLPALISSVLIVVFSLLFLITENRFYIDVLSGICLFSLIVVFLFQSIYYVYISLKGYNLYKKRIEQTFSYSEDIDLAWVKTLVFGFVLLIVCVLGSNSFNNERKVNINKVSSYLGMLKIKTKSNHGLHSSDRIKIIGFTDGIYASGYEIKKIKHFLHSKTKVFEF